MFCDADKGKKKNTILYNAIIVLVCIIFSVFAAYLRSVILNVVAVRMVLRYIEALVSNMLVLASAGKMEDRVVKEMLDS